MTTDLILGTAGHIDHGKTSLIRALTGVDTDRLPEEKRRGITIELGFAHLDLPPYRLGIVDVPGHERFVRQMLVGATSMDLALLVVAADDSVKPQTREHLEVLRLLDLPAGVIALTKCDLAEPEWMDLVEEEIRDLVQGSFLADAEIVRTSAAAGSGLEPLRQALQRAGQVAAVSRGRERAEGPFRMAIDRVFTVPGHGTVVTGSVSTGRTRVGDQVVIEPGGIEVRVRGLQSHDRVVEELHCGQRGAINLAGVHHERIERGQELAAPGHLIPSQLMTVQLELLPAAARPLKHRARVRVHLGTAEVLASVSLLQQARLEPGTSGPAQLFLSEPAVASWNQALVIRSESPVRTIGGGRVLVPAADKLRQAPAGVLRCLEQLLSADPFERAGGALYFAGTRPWTRRDLARLAGLGEVDAIVERLLADGTLIEVRVAPQRVFRWHHLVLDEIAARIEQVLEKAHQREPLRSTIERTRLAHQLAYLLDAQALHQVLERMQKQGRVRLTERGVGLAGHGAQLSQAETRLLAELLQKYREAGFRPPAVKECQQQAVKNRQSVAPLIALAAAEGDLVEVSAEYYLHADVERQLRQTLREKMSDDAGLTMSQIREILNTSRKYAVPICEYLDRAGFTRREGDLRFLAEPAGRQTG
jgi:selenocysteine-specific elongation factor